MSDWKKDTNVGVSSPFPEGGRCWGVARTTLVKPSGKQQVSPEGGKFMAVESR